MNLSKLGNSQGREAWHAAVHRIAKSWTPLGNRIATTTEDLCPETLSGQLQASTNHQTLL